MHILLEKAYKYSDKKNVETPVGYSFNEKKGYWIDQDGMAMVNNPCATVGETKKCDVETGEDQKGE